MIKVRVHGSDTTGAFMRQNTHGLGEVIVAFDDGGMDSMFISELDVYIEHENKWKTFREALELNDLIPDNYNTTFYFAENDEERERGYKL